MSLPKTFPFDLFRHDSMPGKTGELIRSLRPLSMLPPYPWGQWLYGEVLREQWSALEGDLAELGVGKGGTSILLGSWAKEYGKTMWSLDTFIGLPAPSIARDNPYFREGDYGPRDGSQDLLSRFKDNIGAFNLTGAVIPVKGLFEETVNEIPSGKKFCFVHLDSDLYSSTLTSLTQIYDKVVDGGIIAIDDFFHHAQGPLRAASDFFNKRKIYPVYHVSFPNAVVIIKGETSNHAPYRSLDGNIYSFDSLRKDKYFIEVLRESLSKAKQNGEDISEAQNRMTLISLLSTDNYQSSHIYSYWRALAGFWDWAAVLKPDGRALMMV